MWNCFGRAVVDSGQSRVPEPPDMMTGMIRVGANRPSSPEASRAIDNRALLHCVFYRGAPKRQPQAALR